MDTAIVLAGMLLPITAASVFYVGDRRTERRDQAISEQSTVRLPIAQLPVAASEAK